MYVISSATISIYKMSWYAIHLNAAIHKRKCSQIDQLSEMTQYWREMKIARDKQTMTFIIVCVCVLLWLLRLTAIHFVFFFLAISCVCLNRLTVHFSNRQLSVAFYLNCNWITISCPATTAMSKTIARIMTWHRKEAVKLVQINKKQQSVWLIFFSLDNQNIC